MQQNKEQAAAYQQTACTLFVILSPYPNYWPWATSNCSQAFPVFKSKKIYKKAIGKTNRFKLMLYSHPKNRTKEKQGEERKVIGQALGLLVLPGTHITVLTPAAYQPGSLPGTLLAYAMGNLILRLASRLDAFSVYPIRT